MAKIDDPAYPEAVNLTGAFLTGYQGGQTKRFPGALFAGGAGGAGMTSGNISWVDATYGDDETGEVGNPSRPYETAQAAYAAAAALGGNKVLILSPGYHSITVLSGTITGTFVGHSVTATSLGISVYGDSFADATADAAGVVEIEIAGLSVIVNASGGSSWTTDEFASATGGAGGNVTIKGRGAASVNVNGGAASGDGTTTGGNAGQMILKGVTVLVVEAAGGVGGTPGAGGNVFLDDCDAAGCTWNISGASMHFGRTSYSSTAATELSPLYTDRGGNASNY